MINVYFSKQIGFLIAWGTTFERRGYFTIELPLITIQIFVQKPHSH